MSAASHPRRHPDAAFKLVEGEALIVLPGSEATHHVLNEVGARIWELLDGTRDEASICLVLTEEFDVPEDAAREDVREFIDALRRQGMLVTSDEREETA